MAPGKSTILRCSIKREPNLAKLLLTQIANAEPIFGFACEFEERAQRNRITTKQGINTIESWVGRDPKKYVPGFYWLTLLSKQLAERHGVSLAAVGRVAKDHVELDGGQHLFRFYDEPTDWRSDAGVARLCSSLPGLFDIERIRPQVTAAKNFVDLEAVLRDWK